MNKLAAVMIGTVGVVVGLAPRGASAAVPRALPPGETPQDVRLGRLRTRPAVFLRRNRLQDRFPSSGRAL